MNFLTPKTPFFDAKEIKLKKFMIFLIENLLKMETLCSRGVSGTLFQFLFIKFKFFHRNKLPVHVVVDPMLSKVLRPHQREVNKFKTLIKTLKERLLNFSQ